MRCELDWLPCASRPNFATEMLFHSGSVLAGLGLAGLKDLRGVRDYGSTLTHSSAPLRTCKEYLGLLWLILIPGRLHKPVHFLLFTLNNFRILS